MYRYNYVYISIHVVLLQIHRLFMLARLRALQTLIHIEETGADIELNNHIDEILNGLLPELPSKKPAGK